MSTSVRSVGFDLPHSGSCYAIGWRICRGPIAVSKGGRRFGSPGEALEALRAEQARRLTCVEYVLVDLACGQRVTIVAFENN